MNIQSKQAQLIVQQYAEGFSIISINKALVLEAINIYLKYNFSYWDSLIIATALSTDCDKLYSEDLQDGQVIENKLTIVNPFKFVN